MTQRKRKGAARHGAPRKISAHNLNSVKGTRHQRDDAGPTAAASQRDARWFAAHSGEDTYERPAFPGEWPTVTPPALPPGCTCDLALMVAVLQLEPGVRVRRPYWALGVLA